jgi:cytochrome bd-type quinol oxidase subunit 2
MLNLLLNKLTVYAADYSVAPVDVGFKIPGFGDVLTFLIRTFFVVGGIISLLYLLLGAFSWITSGGNKENVDKAREKIQAALIGVILIFVVLAVVTVFEQIFFPADSGLGITKPIKFQRLVQ